MNRPHSLGCNKLEAADVTSGEDYDGVPRIQPQENRCGIVQIDIGLTGSEGGLDALASLPLNIMYVCEAFAPQQLLGYILRSLTNARNLN